MIHMFVFACSRGNASAQSWRVAMPQPQPRTHFTQSLRAPRLSSCKMRVARSRTCLVTRQRDQTAGITQR